MLTEKDYILLHDRYSGFFSYLEFFPKKVDFGILCENSDFDSFVRRSKSRIKCYSILVVISILVFLLTELRTLMKEY
jgi:hypothetical protein